MRNTNIVEDEGLDPGGVVWEPNKTKMEWFIKALHMAMMAISDDEP